MKTFILKDLQNNLVGELDVPNKKYVVVEDNQIPVNFSWGQLKERRLRKTIKQLGLQIVQSKFHYGVDYAKEGEDYSGWATIIEKN